MISPQSLTWMEPLALAECITDSHWILLYSSAHTAYSGRYSYLSCGLEESIEGNDFSLLEGKITADGAPFSPAWFGYLGYGLKDCLETLTRETPTWLNMPDLCMMRFATIYVFDHENLTLVRWGKDRELTPACAPSPLPAVASLTSNMSGTEYLDKVSWLREQIHAGELYQANLTRKFMGSFSHAPDGFSLFRRLCEASPAPYSAFLRMGDTCVLSSSPEQFLRITADGLVKTRPIKGTAPRYADENYDRRSRANLTKSEKDLSENLMIVDLMRNDLSRTCIPGSINTEALFTVTTHATIHHMSSTVTGQRRPECSTLDVVKCAFPPGSMTGAPKIRAMNLCAELERAARGIYSGAIGWFAGDGACELSVVIRTLLLRGERFEFQVGGGIVADSVPEKELAETFAKARGIMSALGVSPNRLAEL